jgi:hypothetical protein
VAPTPSPPSSNDRFLSNYNQRFHGVKSSDPITSKSKSSLPPLASLFSSISTLRDPATSPEWKSSLPSFSSLLRTPFGPPDPSKNFYKHPSFENIAFHVFQSGFLDFYGFASLCSSHPLLHHLAARMVAVSKLDFRSLREHDPDWASCTEIPSGKEQYFLALFFHYDMNISACLRYLGAKYLGGHRDVDGACATMAHYGVSAENIAHYRRIMTAGCPNKFTGETTHYNFEIYRLHGNDPSIARNKKLVDKNMLKEYKNTSAFPLPGWLARFSPHIFLTPQFVLIKMFKDPRQIFNAKFRPTPDAIPINMMTSTPEGSELACLYGSVPRRILQRVWNIRISYPADDIIIHANDVKSCFRQIKHHPDVVGAFCYTIFNRLWVQVGCAFGADFSPANWEGVRRCIEELATGLFQDDTLRDKHRKYLDQLKWDESLDSSRPKRFVPAVADSQNRGVLDDAGHPEDTPHTLFVDDDIYAEVYIRIRIEQAIAASIEAMFITLGESDLAARQDPVSWDKLVEMVISHFNKVLGLVINTRTMDVGPPPEFLARTIQLIDAFHEGRKSFQLRDMSVLVGHLNHIATTSRWLTHLLSHLYTSLAHALADNKAYELHTNKSFREAVERAAKAEFESDNHRTFNEGFIHRTIHRSKKSYFLNSTAKAELGFIRAALHSSTISFRAPIAHLVDRDPTGIGRCDSSLDAGGGWSKECSFWWHLAWSDEIRSATLRFHHNHPDKELISINVLEFASAIIQFAGMSLYYRKHQDPTNPFPVVLIYIDNVAAEIWCIKGCKSSLLGRALGRLLCAIMINNPVGLSTARISTEDNKVADAISRSHSKEDSHDFFASLASTYPQLHGCVRFQPSQELLSALTNVLLTGKLEDPLRLNQLLLENPGSFTT